jgi:hypothetical protein
MNLFIAEINTKTRFGVLDVKRREGNTKLLFRGKELDVRGYNLKSEKRCRASILG